MKQLLMEDKETQQNPPPPPATNHTNHNMSEYEAIKVPILKIHENPIWKVKMAMCLKATDPEYLNRIYDGPHRPMKLAVALHIQKEKMVDKDKKNYSPEDLSSIMKDAKTRHLLHRSFDSVMFNKVIGCKPAKEIWDTLDVKCQDTTSIKKNRRTILTQKRMPPKKNITSNSSSRASEGGPVMDRTMRVIFSRVKQIIGGNPLVPWKEKDEKSVAEYEAKFTELARLVHIYVSSEAQKAKRFQQGLKPEIRSGVVALQLKTYPSVVQAALVIESDQKLASKEKSDKKRKSESITGETNPGGSS
ncbi:hypothetical protein AgCh_005211 [Apium graveolens]